MADSTLTTYSELSTASVAAKASGKQKYWYRFYERYCPVCGRSDIRKERMVGEKPQDWQARHTVVESYDWCLG